MELDLPMSFVMVLSKAFPRSLIGVERVVASSNLSDVERPLASDVAALMALTTAEFADVSARRSPNETAVLRDCVAA